MKKAINLLIGLIISIPMFAQTEYYYFKGQHIPLTVNPKKVNVISMANGPQFAPAVNPNALPAGLEVEAVIPGNPYNMCVIKESPEVSGLLNNYINYSVDPNKFKVLKTYLKVGHYEIVPSNFIYVKLKQPSDVVKLQSVANEYSLSIVHQNLFMPLWYVITTTPMTYYDTVEMANILYETGYFTAAEPDFATDIIIDNISWDEDVSLQWGLYNATDDTIDINASSAWNYATGRGAKVAIFDTGVESNHEDLIDNMSNLNYDTETNSPYRIVYERHGTHVAGIVGASRNNGKFIAGVAPDAEIISISNRFELHSLTTEKLANGFNWAVLNGVDIINCSWHFVESQMLSDAIDNALQLGRNGKGCIVVFSSGNSYSSIDFPANYHPSILAVGSINDNGIRTDFSSFGPELDLVAPGNNIYSTVLNNEAAYLSGTSMAAPHVSGIAALILELNPDLTGQQVRDIMEQSTTKVGMRYYEGEYTTTPGRPNGTWNEYYGYGLVDALKAVQNTPRKQIDY